MAKTEQEDRAGARRGGRGPKLKKAVSFLEEGLWQLDLKSLPVYRRLTLYCARIFYFAVREFNAHRCLLSAAALTYTTLLSLVPLLALMFSVLKGLGVQRRLEAFFLEGFTPGTEEVATRIIEYIDRTNMGTLGALGLAGLVVTAIAMVGGVERELNKIWGVEKGRSWGRKFSDYLSILLICPILVVAALGMTSYIQGAGMLSSLLQLPGVSHLVLLLATLLPYFFIWVALTFVYAYLPNTSIPLLSAVHGGVVAGTLWQLTQLGYVYFQINVAKYNAIYGAFAQLPIFLSWLYIVWAIVLFGAAISFAHHRLSVDPKSGMRLKPHYSFKDREELGLKLLVLVGRNFYRGEEPWSAPALALRLGAASHLVHEILSQHCRAGILRSASKGEEEIFFLARAPEHLPVDQIIEAMRLSDGAETEVAATDGEAKIRKILDQVEESRKAALADVTLRDLLREDAD